MACAMGYMLILKHLSQRYSAFAMTALQAFVGAPFFLLLALTTESVPTEITPQGAAAVVYLGVLVTVGAYGLFNFGISRLPANQASAFVNLIPLFTLFFAVVVLGETLNGQQIAAALVVFAGVALSQWQRPVIPATSVVLD